ncbi:Amino-acid acetyltransferase, mitochondrial [Desmophyllum pertusum]|uniref:Arginase n=1 Tax=Desmophyllum pertusum TaxID=174260 RepID=A0A9W9ZEA8_9CNID|nr:Amino-acid acetyltransferase, mitochondrial [Desmophyllum pertusum]
MIQRGTSPSPPCLRSYRTRSIGESPNEGVSGGGEKNCKKRFVCVVKFYCDDHFNNDTKVRACCSEETCQIVSLRIRKTKRVVLDRVPFSGGQPRKGVEEGPSRLRKQGYKISDFGELQVPDIKRHNITNTTLVKNSLECGTVSEKLSQEIAKATQEGKLSLTIGGDHSIAVGSVFGHASVAKDLGLLWIDAHMDINTPATTTTGNIHGMPMSMLIKGIPEFQSLPGYEWCSPCLSPEDVAYIGLRDVEPQEREICEKLGIASYTIDDIDKDGIGVIIKKALKRINPNGDRPIHVSYDIDSLDPKETPSTGTPVRGGLTLDEGIYIAQIVAQSGCLSGIDIVEFNPAIGTEEDVIKTAKNTMELIKILLGKKSHLEKAPLPPVDDSKASSG